MTVKEMTAEEMADCINEMLGQVAFHATEPVDNYYDLMEAACNLYGFLYYDIGCRWEPHDDPTGSKGGEPFDF